MEIKNSYPTPIGTFNLENSDDLNKGLSEFICGLRNEDSPSRSMVGGYHTKEDLLSRNNPFIQEFHKIISKQILEYHSNISRTPLGPNTKMVSWGMIYNSGDHSVTHTHAQADISSAYYCKVPKGLSNGQGEFRHLDPRPAARWDTNFAEQSFQEITPKEGMGIIFPGWLEHYVTPHNLNEERICITTNVFIDHGTFFK